VPEALIVQDLLDGHGDDQEHRRDRELGECRAGPRVPGGGGIYNSGALTLLGVTVTGNSGPDPGLLNEGGTLTIKDSTIQP